MDAWTRVFVHLVWATWDRQEIITPRLEPTIHRIMAEQCRALLCEPLAINGTADHVHALVRMHPSVGIATLVRAMKGASSRCAAKIAAAAGGFRWQGGYAALSVQGEAVSLVVDYIVRQKEHHATVLLQADLERCVPLDRSPPGR